MKVFLKGIYHALLILPQYLWTIVNAAKALKDRGAKEVYVYITHGVLSGEAVKKIKNSVIKNLVITDTIDNIINCVCNY